MSTSPPGWQPDPEFWRHRPVAVTGATGLLGSHLVGVLAGMGAEVAVLVRDGVPPSPVSAAWQGSVAVVAGSVEDQAVCERLLGEYRAATVFHLAAQTQVGVANRNAVSTFESNIRGTWSLLEAARRSPAVTAVVLASSDKAYGDQPTLPYDEDMPLLAVHPYDVSKACADLLARSYAATWGVPAGVTRCGNFFGPGDTNWERLVPGTVRSVLEGRRPEIRSDGTLTRDYLYVEDGALAYLCLAEALSADPTLAGQAFNFSTEQPVDVLRLTELIQKAAGTALEPLVLGTATSEIQDQWLSAAKARRVLGWSPRHGLEDGLALTVAWYRSFLGAS
jgi:CDP-glucose 4,6-dehydratase